ncbi:MAG: hypothetical protein ACH350_00970 [Parachlamydiaceae bacterium]
MSTQMQDPMPHFNSFHEDNAILIQFIVEKFIRTHHLTSQMKKLIEERVGSDAPLSPPALIQILSEMIGSPQQQEHPSISRWIEGPLTKFKEYCEQFSRNSSHENKCHVHLHMAAHQAWLMAVYNLELLNSLWTNPYIPHSRSSLFYLPIKRSFQTFQIRLNQVYRYIPRILHDFADNENVVYYLMRNQRALSEIYKEDFFHKQFKWSKKSSPAIALLVSRYQTRGFEAIPPSIQHLYDTP